MSIRITGKYLGNKTIKLTHTPSGMEITTAAPKDNQGDGSSFSPTDLAASALGSCMVTIIAIVADRDGLDVSGMHFEVEKHMSDSPRRIGSLPVTIWLPTHLGDKDRRKLESAAKACPVHKSLHPDIDTTIRFVYE